MSNFRVGQKVVCIDVKPMPNRAWEEGGCPIKLGEVYTIHALALSPADGGPCVFLREVKRSIGWPFGIFRFRPVVVRKRKRKTSIAIFKKLLISTPADLIGVQ